MGRCRQPFTTACLFSRKELRVVSLWRLGGHTAFICSLQYWLPCLQVAELQKSVFQAKAARLAEFEADKPRLKAFLNALTKQRVELKKELVRLQAAVAGKGSAAGSGGQAGAGTGVTVLSQLKVVARHPPCPTAGPQRWRAQVSNLFFCRYQFGQRKNRGQRPAANRRGAAKGGSPAPGVPAYS